MNTRNNKTVKTPSQKDRVRSVLTRKTRNTITAAQAASQFGIKNLSARISELRNQDGLEITIDFRQTRDGRSEAIYRLASVV